MLRVISYNIRNSKAPDGEQGWQYRKDRVAGLLTLYQPDLIGLQEVLSDQLADLTARLPAFTPLGVGRDDGNRSGEHALIFYRHARLKAVANGTFWLSPTPDVAGSIGWDASYPRLVTWAIFVDQRSGATIRQLNTHFDHRGHQARLESAHLLRRFLANDPNSVPTIITGDFNCTTDTQPYHALTSGCQSDGAPLCDAMAISNAPHHGPTATTNSSFCNPLRHKIDYIFCYPPESIQILRHAVLADHWDGIYPSDHLPVLADIALE